MIQCDNALLLPTYILCSNIFKLLFKINVKQTMSFSLVCKPYVACHSYKTANIMVTFYEIFLRNFLMPMLDMDGGVTINSGMVENLVVAV